ncbi:MAG: tetratricopeptide repeat protein [Treponema sp.]|jgi:tetratricopeptide (TPR) repeat protein|nr:tetratricopeptide repeat protein [Treponema sp.]
MPILLFLFAFMLIFSGCAGKPVVLETESGITEAKITETEIAETEVKNIYGKFLSPEAEELVLTGIDFHDRREYGTAIDYYKKAMDFSPEHPVIYFEWGFSSISMGDPDTALEMAEKGIVSAKAINYAEIIPTLMDLKGSALDNLGKTEEAIAVYQQVINEYGVVNTLVFYNLAVSYYRIDRREEAYEALSKGLVINLNHARSNYLLGRICIEEGRKTQAFFSLCYFLLMEPNTERAAQMYGALLQLLSGQDETIGIRLNGFFTPADMIISVAFTLDEANFRLSEGEKIKAKLYYVFTSLEEQKNSGKINRSQGDELWWDTYSPFFYRIVKSEYFDTFCRYIGLTMDPDADSWIENDREEIEGFFEWLNAHSI